MPDDTRADDIVGAAARLLTEGGVGAVTTRAVAQAAGVQPPTIYRLFGDKDGLLDAVAEHAMTRYVDRKHPGQHGDDPVADLRAAWLEHLEFGLEHPALYALLVAPGRTVPSPATARGDVVLRERVRRVAAAGRLAVPDTRAIGVMRAAGVGLVLTLADTAPAERDPGLVDAVWAAVATAILTDAPPPEPADPPIAAAVRLAALVDDLPALSDGERTLLAEWLGRAITSARG